MGGVYAGRTLLLSRLSSLETLVLVVGTALALGALALSRRCSTRIKSKNASHTDVWLWVGAHSAWHAVSGLVVAAVAWQAAAARVR